jgi:hypothetical protein
VSVIAQHLINKFNNLIPIYSIFDGASEADYVEQIDIRYSLIVEYSDFFETNTSGIRDSLYMDMEITAILLYLLYGFNTKSYSFSTLDIFHGLMRKYYIVLDGDRIERLGFITRMYGRYPDFIIFDMLLYIDDVWGIDTTNYVKYLDASGKYRMHKLNKIIA